MRKDLDERIDEGVLRLFEEDGRNRIANKVYVREYAGSRSVGSPRKIWIDTVNECLKKRGLDIRQARRMVQDRSEWRGFVRGECMGRSPEDKPLTLTRCHSCGLPQLYEAPEGGSPSEAEPTT